MVPFHMDLLPYWEAFCEAHKNRNKLKTFRVKNIFIPPSPFFEQNLMPIFTSAVNLTSLELRSCGLECCEIVLVASFVKRNSSLSILDLSSNKIDSVEAAQSLSLAIKSHAELCFVNLSHCSLGENPAVLNAVLDGCKGLKSLLIDDNGIFNVNGGCFAVVEFLSSNAAITLFSMANNVNLLNVIGNDQVKMLSQSLKKNTSLRHLCLGLNRLSFPSFLTSRRVTENLTHLDLTANNIRTQGAKLVAQFLSQNRTLEELNLAYNSINSHSASSLGSALKQNTTLRHLNLSLNSLTDRPVPAFVDAMKNNRTLLTLDLSGNTIKVRSG
jgi:Ran GTPase-activating protein (RanGAP) involved in mRNA processing and transport